MRKAIIPMVLAAVAVTATPAAAATPKAGSWNGDIATRGSVHFKVKKQDGKAKVTKAKVKNAKMTCTSISEPSQTHSETISTTLYNLPIKVKNGKFTSNEVGAASVELSGKFTSNKKANGTFSYGYFHGGEDCETGKLSWNAKLE